MNFCTTAEALAIAFPREVDPAYISDNAIAKAQAETIRPALSEEFYEELTNGSLSEANQYLVDNFLKRATAYAVTVQVAPNLAFKLSTRGILDQSALNREADSYQRSRESQLQIIINSARENAQFWLNECIRYIERNEDSYPTYKSNKPTARFKTIGGYIWL